ncbi:MAG: hypothetical protein PHG54_05440 [Smithellaceae bacterium]|nr:hypothetical protein [Syntrophaceae bacterium]MDD4240855.1 hypothetical protein [Smithellaceae bacterium]NLX51719.1 hypothetical protein [Deltaproteobacteria bacterium]
MKKLWMAAVVLIFWASGSYAEDFLSVSGKLHLRGVVPLHSESVTEYPSLLGQLKVDTKPSPLRFHMWLEGGWDGSVTLPVEDHSTLKFGDRVYQSTTPFLEFKELYGSYSTDWLEVRAGIQRFAWGRLDEYPVNDLLNPWDYSQFLRKPLEDRKIGVPSLSTRLSHDTWSLDAVWVPVFIPYRLPLSTERWSPFNQMVARFNNLPVNFLTSDADLPSRNLASGSGGLRLSKTGIVDWNINLFHGYDPRPVMKATQLIIAPVAGQVAVEPGTVADFHKMSSFGVDAAFVTGPWSLRAEAAYAIGRYFNTNLERWGYPAVPAFGVYPLAPNEHKSDSLEYGVGADYRVFEDCLLTMQAQQTVILDRPDSLYQQKFETIFWANLRNGFLNQRILTNLNAAYNPEHGGVMARANVWYVLSDFWKVGIAAVGFWGPDQSLFGRYKTNDQVEVDLVFSW